MTRPISSGSRGAASELRAGAYLIDQGYHVFRSESPGSPFDLVVYRDGNCFRVEVKTLQITTNAPSFAIPAHQNQWDLLVLVAPDRILIFDSSRSVSEIKEDLREAYGWPRRPPQQLRPCGTSAGVTRHRAKRQALCPPCRQAYEEGTQPPQSDAEGSGGAQDVREALGAQKGAQGASEAAMTTEAYEAAIDVLARKADTTGGQWSAAWVVPDDLLTEVLAAVWPLAVTEGRRQAVEAIRERVGDIAANEWAALIVEEEGRG